MDKSKNFYDREYTREEYGKAKTPEQHPRYKKLIDFIEKYDLCSKKCLEIGCGRGIFQDLVIDYIGVDISDSVRSNMHKPFYQCSATELHFKDSEFDAVWTLTVLEHVPEPEKALYEIRRVLKPDGLLLFAPAWHTRPWFAEGLPVRQCSDLDFKGKFNKALIPIRDFRLFRIIKVLLKRTKGYLRFLLCKHPLKFRYKKLTPNYDHYWMSDSDACNSMDQFEAIVWFKSHGDNCLSHPDWKSQFFIMDGEIIFQIKK